MTALEESYTIAQLMATKGKTANDLVQEAWRLGGKVFPDVSWETYQAIMKDYGQQPLHYTYDQGMLEIMPTSPEHEEWKWLLARCVEIWAEETGRDFWPGGSLTVEREDLVRALAADECYWIANVRKMENKPKLDFARDPPPDLWIEIEKTRTVLSRLQALAALKVPEIWRFNGKSLRIGLLQRNGSYRWGQQSKAFPDLPIEELNTLISQVMGKPRLQVMRRLREWVRQNAGSRRE